MPDPKKRDEQPPSTQPDPSVPGEEVLPDEPPPKPPPEKKKEPPRKSRGHDGWDEHDAAVIKNGNVQPGTAKTPPIRKATPARGMTAHGTHRQVFSAMTVQILGK